MKMIPIKTEKNNSWISWPLRVIVRVYDEIQSWSLDAKMARFLTKFVTPLLFWPWRFVVRRYDNINALTQVKDKRGTTLLLSAFYGVLFTSVLIVLVYILVRVLPDSDFIKFLFPVDAKKKINGILGHVSVNYILGFLVGLLPAFTLWRFRDLNKLKDQEIAHEIYENSRKDTNLKDFQQLEKWAVGLETSIEGKELTQNNPLQIAAIHQLGGFFRGEFGEQFQRPAYELLNAVWVNQLVGIETPENMDRVTTVKHGELILTKTRNAVAHAIVTAVFGDGGKKLVELEKKILTNSPSLIKQRDWRGLNASSGLSFTNASLSEINLSFSDLSHADFRNANLTGAVLSDANLSNVNLVETCLLGVRLSNSNLSGAKLNRAFLVGTDLSGASLRGADLSGADLCAANLLGADLSSARLFNIKHDENLKLTNDNNYFEIQIGFYTILKSDGILFDRIKTNELRAKLGLGEIIDLEMERLIKQIRLLLKYNQL